MLSDENSEAPHNRIGGSPGSGDSQARQLAGAGTSPAVSLTTPVSPPDRERLLPGTVVAGRYRIVAPLGQGGMGSVYRADDLTLDQPVALKFLRSDVARDPVLLDCMLNEVRLSRQIAHPNVCRVYDVGVADEQHFLSMEYVDGEDLSSLLRRIGRLPGDKAMQIARQIVAGLGAAHAIGILHRDLKPANIMIDGRGNPKITDFGLAAHAEKLSARELGMGTPAYMAPEQLAGQEVSVRSDIYALGLVLYELFTGTRAFAATGLTELRLQREQSTPRSPTSIVAGIDLAVESVILRCLSPVAADRPSSAAEILIALPGRDPLSASLLAGETPPPEMVAAAQEETSSTPKVATACFAATVLGALLLAALTERTMLHARASLELSPDVLHHQAAEILVQLGIPANRHDRAHGFASDVETLAHAERNGSPATGGFAGMYYWYRSSPELLGPAGERVSLADPPSTTPGSASVVLTGDGRLLEFQVVSTAIAGSGAPDWGQAFLHAGLELESFDERPAEWLPPVFADTRREWIDEESRLRVRAGSVGNRLTYFHAFPSWRDALLAAPPAARQRTRTFQGWYSALYLGVVLACAVAARRNLRLGRGDKRGANRVALYIFAVTLVVGLLVAHHVPDAQMERHLLIRVLGAALFSGVFLSWLPYVALEPSLRRAWPRSLVSWTRLLAGQFRDPLIGRDLTIGALTAVVTQLLLCLYVLAPGWLGLPPSRPETIWPETLLGLREAVAAMLRMQPVTVFYGLGLMVMLLALRALTRSMWIAAPLLVSFVTLAVHPEVSTLHPALGLSITSLRIGVFVFVLVKFGLLAGIVALFFDGALNVLPLTLDPSVWYADVSLFAGLSVVLVAAWGLRQALPRRPVTAMRFAR